MVTTAFIPARGGSKGIKNKNIVTIAGKPLIYYVLTALNNAKNIDKIIVATDSEKICEVVNSFEYSKVEIYHRSPQNAQDTSATIDVVEEYLDFANLSPQDLFLTVQATSPLLTSNEVDEFISGFIKSNRDAGLSCVEFPRFCWTPDGIPVLHEINQRKRRQDLRENILVENGAMYIARVDYIKNHSTLFTNNAFMYKMPSETLTEIDEPKDLEVVEQFLKKRIKPDIKDYDIFLTDCDGVLTDGGMYYTDDGEVEKKFNTTDGCGISQIKSKGLYVAIVTGEDSEIVKKRAKKLGIDCFCAVKNKLKTVQEIVQKNNSDLSRVIYIGDDINDLEVIKSAGFSACPSNAQDCIKKLVNYETSLPGGMGAVREVANLFLD